MANDEVKNIKRTFKRLLIFGGALFFTGVLFVAIEHKFNTTGGDLIINIEPLDEKRFIMPEDVQQLVKSRFYPEENARPLTDLLLSEPLKRINLRAIETEIERYPWVKNAEVYIDISNNIYIDIEQRKPILRCFDEDGNGFYVDAEGRKMPVSRHETTRVIAASGYITSEKNKVPADSSYNVVDSLCKLVLFMEKDSFLVAQFEQIYVSSNQDLVLIPKVGDSEVILGGLDRLEEKIFYLKTFYREAMPRKGWRRYDKLNLKYNNQVIGVKN